MNPHLVTAAADEAYVPPEPRVADVELSMATVPSAQQVSDLLAGHRHGVRRTQSSYWDRRLHTRLARRQARQRYWAAAVERSGLAVERARSNLADTPAVRRPYGRFGAILGGVAMKSVAVGALVPLTDGVSQLSSVLMFAGLALGELAGAAALAARQHRPGARAYTAACDQYRRGMIINELAHARLRVAESSADAAAQALAVHLERKEGRARLALVSGWTRAVQHSRNGDGLLGRVEIPPISITRP
jgi:hypothetical protein